MLRNAHFSINSGAKFSHSIIWLHLYKNYYDYNIAERQANGKTKLLDKKFGIDTETCMVVSNYNGHLLVHIHKFIGDFFNKRGGLYVHQPIPAVIGVVRKGRKRYPQPWYYAHKNNKVCCNFVIESRLRRTLNVYVLRDLSGETLQGVFYEEQLQRVKAPDVFPISRIVRKSGKRAFVEWRGWPEKFNSWIALSDLQNKI